MRFIEPYINQTFFMNYFSKLTNWYFSRNALPFWCILAIDSFVVMFVGYVVGYMELGGLQFAMQFRPLTWGIVLTLFCYVLAFRYFHTYIGVVRYASFVDLQRLLAATAAGSVLSLLITTLLQRCHTEGLYYFNVRDHALSFALTSLWMGGIRVMIKTAYDTFRKEDNAQRVFIYGVRAGGVALAKSIRNESPCRFTLVGFVSPDGRLDQGYLLGVKVRRDGPNLVGHMLDTKAEALIVSPLEVERFRENSVLIGQLIEAKIRILMMPEVEEWDGKSDINHSRLREVDIEDLLPRDKIEVDMEVIGALLRGRRILVTGAAGSIGSEMVKQVAVYQPSEMILVDQAETPMHDVRMWMAKQYPLIKALTVVVSITNKEYMEKLFAEHRPEYVFHAAAYKHVPMMEDNPAMAVQNNVYGTRVIADLSVKYGVRKFVMISTDKAVNPTNVMGCSKRICEIYCQALSKAVAEGKIEGVTQFVTTRFGNVLGSNGSVIPIFKEQIRNGGPVTVTHPNIIRFFMLIPEACRLVLEAGTMGHGGEIFVFDMGKPVRIVDLAQRMIALSGAKDVEIRFTGLRDGEKLFEEVLSDKESSLPTHHPKIMVAKVREYDYGTALVNEERLLKASYSFDDMTIVKIMKEIVPEFKSSHSKYEVLDV
jgi:FlaA1/EpsC-like NDP-sugar epimerase